MLFIDNTLKLICELGFTYKIILFVMLYGDLRISFEVVLSSGSVYRV
jgi:hypothetical protein